MMQAMPIFPVATEQRWVHELAPVPFTQKCLQTSYKDKDGKDRVRTECTTLPMMAMPRLETIDLNQQARNAYVRSCTHQSCFVSYGNTSCQVPAPEAAPKP